MTERKFSILGRALKYRSICEVHREMYDLINVIDELNDTDRALLLERIEEVYDMAKRMNSKLVEYKYNFTIEERHRPDDVNINRGVIKEYRKKVWFGQEITKEDKDSLKEAMASVSKNEVRVSDIVMWKKSKKFIEIGGWKSKLSKWLLENCNEVLEEYWAVDPWHELDYYLYACKLMIRFPKLRTLKLESTIAANLFPDKYFDFVYIDADHNYKAVQNDIKSWLPKVKSKGVIAGHDYDNKKYPEVKPAVDQFFNDNKTKVIGTIWYKEKI